MRTVAVLTSCFLLLFFSASLGAAFSPGDAGTQSRCDGPEGVPQRQLTLLPASSSIIHSRRSP